MIKANVEFDNLIASPLSPLMFIALKVFGENVKFVSYDDEKQEAKFDVYSLGCGEGDIKIMEITLKNLEQV